MNVWHFTVASFFGRAGRFFLVSIVLMIFGEWIKQYLELVILAVSVVIVIFFIVLWHKSKKSMKKSAENAESAQIEENKDENAIHNL